MSHIPKADYTFPVGYHMFHKKQVFNFQLNRYYSLGYARYEDMEEAGQRIETLADWKLIMQYFAESAISENRLKNAAIYYRAAEFYLTEQDPDKDIFYDRFIELFDKVMLPIHKSVCALPSAINRLLKGDIGQKIELIGFMFGQHLC